MRGFALSVLFGLSVLEGFASRAAAQADLEAMRERAAIRYGEVPRKVLAFYYPWYHNPAVRGGSKLRMSWENVDEKAKSISNATHYPALGPYDSHDPKLIAQHAAWSKKAGVDGWIVSWWGKGHETDRVMERILDACQKAALEVTIYYETVPAPRNGQSAAKDLLYVLDRYAKHPAWLRVDKKPVLFIYGRALGEIGLAGWLEAITEVNRQYPRKAVFLGDQLSTAAARIFDGIHTYNPAGMLPKKTLPRVHDWAHKTYPAWVETADAQGRISTITVIPGYDDTKIRKPGLRVDRMDGALYRAEWEEAIAADPHWVLVTSWNEWYEGSEIEPSAEHGEKFLKMTAEYAARFKVKPRAVRAKVGEAGRGARTLSPAETSQLAKIRSAILPEPHVPAEFPFPSSVDPRWRPFVRSQMAPGDLVVPLVDLRDGQGRHYGDAVVYAAYKTGEPKGGRVAYVWFSLLDVPQGDTLLDDLLLFVAAKLAAG